MPLAADTRRPVMATFVRLQELGWAAGQRAGARLPGRFSRYGYPRPSVDSSLTQLSFHPFSENKSKTNSTPILMLCAAMQYSASFLFTPQSRTSKGLCSIWLLADSMALHLFFVVSASPPDIVACPQGRCLPILYPTPIPVSRRCLARNSILHYVVRCPPRILGSKGISWWDISAIRRASTASYPVAGRPPLKCHSTPEHHVINSGWLTTACRRTCPPGGCLHWLGERT